MEYFTEGSKILYSDKKWNIFYNKNDLGYRICRKYNENLYICFINKNKYNKELIKYLSITIYNMFITLYIFDYTEAKTNNISNIIYKKINKNIMKDLLYIKKEFINDFVIKNKYVEL